jgi:ADP-ribose pyrophosphatase
MHPLYTELPSPVDFLPEKEIYVDDIILETTKKLGFTLAHASRWIRSERIIYKDKNTDDIKSWEYTERKNSDGVVVIWAITREKTMIILDQFRIPVRRWVIENPAGLIDEGETPEDAAVRELEEEIGYTPWELTYLGQSPSSGWLTSEIPHLYLATDCIKIPGWHRREASEWIRQFEVPVWEVWNLLDWLEPTRLIDPKLWRMVSVLWKK